jgi:hypothetical protein
VGSHGSSPSWPLRSQSTCRLPCATVVATAFASASRMVMFPTGICPTVGVGGTSAATGLTR